MVDITPALAARQIIDTMAEGLLVFDRDGAIRVANAAAERFGGLNNLLGVSCADLDRRWFDGSLVELLDPEQRRNGEITFARPDGDKGVAAVSSSKLHDARGEWVGVVCIVHDITERQRSEAAVRASEALYRALVETSPDGVLATDSTGTILMTNGRAAALIGLTPQETVGRDALDFITPEDRERLLGSVSDSTGDTVARDSEYALARADGTTVAVELSMTRVPAENSEVRLMAVVRDITERKQREEEIRHLAFHDSLTGAVTRAVLRDRMSEAIARSRRAGTHAALVFADLDGFKRINDTKGHDAGDDVLRDVSRVLTGVLRESDTLARVGGDEFVLLVPDLPGPEAAASVAQRILRELHAAAASTRAVGVTVSLGVAVFPGDADGVDELLRHADRAMYEAKRRGGDQFHVWEPGLRQVA
jgi:diguanylate cyclase (GGDEF)-like protein/PAS domain S-box-containing protein